MDTNQNPAKYLTVHGVCERYSLSRSTLYRLISSGRMPRPLKIGTSPRWRTAELDAWIESGNSAQPGKETLTDKGGNCENTLANT